MPDPRITKLAVTTCAALKECCEADADHKAAACLMIIIGLSTLYADIDGEGARLKKVFCSAIDLGLGDLIAKADFDFEEIMKAMD